MKPRHFDARCPGRACRGGTSAAGTRSLVSRRAISAISSRHGIGAPASGSVRPPHPNGSGQPPGRARPCRPPRPRRCSRRHGRSRDRSGRRRRVRAAGRTARARARRHRLGLDQHAHPAAAADPVEHALDIGSSAAPSAPASRRHRHPAPTRSRRCEPGCGWLIRQTTSASVARRTRRRSSIVCALISVSAFAWRRRLPACSQSTMMPDTPARTAARTSSGVYGEQERVSRTQVTTAAGR